MLKHLRCNAHSNFGNMMQWISMAFGLVYKDLLRILTNINADKDQALQLILVGQPQLRETFNIKELEQLNQPATASYHLDKLNQCESDSYIMHRLKVSDGRADLISNLARKAIWYHSHGIPRIINTLCDTALIYAYAEKKLGKHSTG